jgi:predicted ATP-dependent protease
MAALSPLPSTALRRLCDPAQFQFASTAELADLDRAIGQERALSAVEFGVGIGREGYNLFALGPTGAGKHTLLTQFLNARATREPTPDNWCYVNNFAESYKPQALRLPPGRGAKLQGDMRELVEELQVAVPAAFESDEYRSRVAQIDAEFNEIQGKAFVELGDEAESQDIALVRTPGGFSLAPMKDGEVISPDEYARLPEERQQAISEKISALQERLEKLLRQVPGWRRARRERLKQLNEEVTLFAVGQLVEELMASYADLSEVKAYLESVRRDVIENVDDFRKPGEGATIFQAAVEGEAPSFRRYEVNLLVDHAPPNGAPVVFEPFPSYQNLVGRVEHRARFGTLVTEFGLIKAGALHRANGGYLLLDAAKVLSQPYAWEGLKRALISREVRIESLGEMLSLVSTASLEPQPISLSVKVILFGERWLYYLLYALDPDFCKLFKVPADFEDDVVRNGDNQLLYARLVASVARRQGLLPFDRSAVARVIEQGARFAEDAEKLSVHMQSLADLLGEADFWARQAGRSVVAREDAQRAIDAQIERSDRIRIRMQDEILSKTVLIDTDGAKVGQVNGLSVFSLGDFPFSQPTRITARTRLGDGEVIDIQREAQLGGAIHSKGVLILTAFLAARYSGNQPHSLSASVTFEQTYGQVDGDSASVAELCALLSSLADVPIKQSLAVTGSVNQHGEVQAIGAVNEKVEGFFDVCRARGLTGDQGVLIPQANVKHLMLRQDLVEAAEAGRFHIYAVASVDEAIELLTGVSAGDPNAIGELPRGSINELVRRKLAGFAAARRAFVGVGARGEKRGKWKPK